jgi:spore germination protein KC
VKRRIVTCLISATLLLSGCWDQRELSTITVVIGMAVDKGEHARYKVSLEGVNAS